MNRLTTILIVMLVSLMMQAQNTFTQNLEKINSKGAAVNVHQSSEITKLVNGTAGASAQQNATTPATTTEDKTDKQPATHKNTQSTTTTDHQAATHKQQLVTDDDDDAMQEADHSKKVMRNSYKTNGYRVQVFAGGNTRADRQKTERIGNQIKNLFPSEPVYTHFYSPRWICRMGNYRTYEEAYEMLGRVKKAGFKEAVIVKGKITVAY